MVNGWERVSPQTPCPVCGKPDWCLIQRNDGVDITAVICPRTREGAKLEIPESGFLHILKEQKYTSNMGHSIRLKTEKKQIHNFAALAADYAFTISEDQVQEFANTLGVSSLSLHRLGIGWDGYAYTFPMKNEASEVIGIRRRIPGGGKWATKNSTNGLFIPTEFTPESHETIAICEGESDTAAALDQGFTAVGRPGCRGGISYLRRLCFYSHVLIISDNDESGIRGTELLSNALLRSSRSVRTVCPPSGIKDLRDWSMTGVTKSEILAIASVPSRIHDTIIRKGWNK